MSEKSWRTVFGQWWWGRVFLVGTGVGLCGNIAMVVYIASPSMAWRSSAKPRMYAVVLNVGYHWVPNGDSLPAGRPGSLIERGS